MRWPPAAGETRIPWSLVQSYDQKLTCQQLQAEITGNESKVKSTIKEDDKAHDSNVGIGVAAIFLWPVLFALDDSDAQKEEIAALRARNAHLVAMMDSRGCNAPALTIVEGPAAAPGARQPGQPLQVATAPAASTPRAHWAAQGQQDSCGKSYAIDMTAENGLARGYVQRGDASYTINGRLDAQGNLTSSVASISQPAADKPKFLTLNLNLSGASALGTFKAFDGYHFTCETAVALQRLAN